MTKKSWLLIVFACVLAVVYAYYFTDWFTPKVIHIASIERPMRVRGRAARGRTITVVTFSLGQRYRLTDVKVVPLAVWQTNQSVLPLWHLISDSNSAPITFFRYGQNIRGMKPAVPRARPEPLRPNITYRLFVQTTSLKGRHDFRLGAQPAAAAANQ